jgi:RNA-directed DNA polymerase
MIKSFDIEHVTFSELYDAYVACRKRKRHTSNAATFEIDLADNLYKLWIELNDGTYEIGKSSAFIL